MYPTFKYLIFLPLTAFIAGCHGPRGVSACANELEYVVNPSATGSDAIGQASAYLVSFLVGDDNFYIHAKLDTGTSQLIINESDFVAGLHTRLGKKAYGFQHHTKKSLAINAVDNIQIGCSDSIDTRFGITAQARPTGNILGLAFGDPERLPHEANNLSFYDQLVKNNNFKDVISLALCAGQGNSHVLFGGIDEKMKNQLHNIIRLKEKSSYVVPALALRRADTKEVLGYFPDYDPKTFGGTKTILDSGTSFNLLPTDMADKIATELIASARQRGLYNKLPKNFFRTDRGASTQVAKFNNLKQIRQFPSFEITFEGADGNVKALELSPLHYLKEMSTTDPLIRTFAIRESRGPIVLGQPFLENHYVVLDRKNALVAFGDIDHACSY